MARQVLGLVLLGVSAGLPAVGGMVEFREQARPGGATRVVVALKAEGLFRPGPPPGVTVAEQRKPLALRVEARLDCTERVLQVDSHGRASRVVRRVAQAASAINGEIRPTSSVLRPEVALLVAEVRPQGVVVTSPGGPLTRAELELVQGVGDPLVLGGLLPGQGKQVAVGDRWTVDDAAARGLSGYDALAANALAATLETLDEASAKCRLRGEIRGAVLGGEGVVSRDGWFTFDRKAGRVDRLTLNRSEARKPGPVEEGLDIKSSLTVERRAAAADPALGDDALARLPLEPDPRSELLLFQAPDGKYALRHDRDWHIYWDDTRQTVLKRLDRGEVVAQCNLSVGPDAGKGRHQDLAQFRDDVRRALGRRLVQILGAGEVEGDPAGGFRYKVGVQGREADLEVLWYYFLVASPEGDQRLITFTLPQAQSKAFGDQDLQLVGSLRWKVAAEPPAPKP